MEPYSYFDTNILQLIYANYLNDFEQFKFVQLNVELNRKFMGISQEKLFFFEDLVNKCFECIKEDFHKKPAVHLKSLPDIKENYVKNIAELNEELSRRDLVSMAILKCFLDTIPECKEKKYLLPLVDIPFLESKSIESYIDLLINDVTYSYCQADFVCIKNNFSSEKDKTQIICYQTLSKIAKFLVPEFIFSDHSLSKPKTLSQHDLITRSLKKLRFGESHRFAHYHSIYFVFDQLIDDKHCGALTQFAFRKFEEEVKNLDLTVRVNESNSRRNMLNSKIHQSLVYPLKIVELLKKLDDIWIACKFSRKIFNLSKFLSNKEVREDMKTSLYSTVLNHLNFDECLDDSIIMEIFARPSVSFLKYMRDDRFEKIIRVF